MDINKYDIILCVKNTDKLINEDDRIHAQRGQVGYDVGINKMVTDPYLYDSMSFGRTVQRSLDNLGDGFYSEVSDFGKYIIVTVGYSNTTTGRQSQKTFLIVFEDERGNGKVFSTSNKWRTISGAAQAVSYIRSIASILRNDTNRKL